MTRWVHRLPNGAARWVVAAAALVIGVAPSSPGVSAQVNPAAGVGPSRPELLPGAAIFDQPTVCKFQIELSPEAHESLRREPRQDAPATVTIDGAVFTNVAIHLKGAAGSYRHLDDRPALTLSFNKFVEGVRWHGLRKIHLNNSVQDDSYMHEYLASELFRAAGVPTPRVAYATVEINQRPVGLYVLKEGWTADFLRVFFRKSNGNLYDGGFVSDIDTPLERDQGKGAGDHKDLERLEAAARHSPRAHRWARLRELLDVDRFASYLVISVFLADWDGYALNRNNYRIYFEPDSGRAVFMPHGMDQVFQRTDLELESWFNGLVAQGFIQTEEGRALYQQRCRELFTRVFRLDRITNTVQRLADTLRPVAPEIDQHAAFLRHRVKGRFRHLAGEELLQSPPGGQPVSDRAIEGR